MKLKHYLILTAVVSGVFTLYFIDKYGFDWIVGMYWLIICMPALYCSLKYHTHLPTMKKNQRMGAEPNIKITCRAPCLSALQAQYRHGWTKAVRLLTECTIRAGRCAVPKWV